jgi:glyoxylase-like metal-dependent hydrolase (beta-lactamase superfamily II)
MKNPATGKYDRSVAIAEPAPGVYRLGDFSVNFYAVEQGDQIVLVDSGLPAHYDQLTGLLKRLGRTVSDVKAVLLTHAHPDHLGLAARLHEQAGADIWVHEADVAALADPRHATKYAKPERSLLRYLLRRPAALSLPLHLARAGAFKTEPVPDPRVFTTRGILAGVPGRPEAIPVPGHTPGSTAFAWPEYGVVFTGDALVTADGLTGATGPRLVNRGFTHDSAAARDSLGTLAQLTGYQVVLPGHGEPVTTGIAGAAGQARQAHIA